MNKINANENTIVFSDGSTLKFDTFEPDGGICGDVSPDYDALNYTGFDQDDTLTAKTLHIKKVNNTGFRIENKVSGRGYYLPCHNIQDGWYSDSLAAILRNPKGKVLEEIDTSIDLPDDDGWYYANSENDAKIYSYRDRDDRYSLSKAFYDAVIDCENNHCDATIIDFQGNVLPWNYESKLDKVGVRLSKEAMHYMFWFIKNSESNEMPGILDLLKIKRFCIWAEATGTMYIKKPVKGESLSEMFSNATYIDNEGLFSFEIWDSKGKQDSFDSKNRTYEEIKEKYGESKIKSLDAELVEHDEKRTIVLIMTI